MKFHKIQGYIQAIYLIEYKHGLLLLDGCSRPDVTVIESFIINELARPFTDLKVVMVTHTHPDHAGAAHKLRKRTGCKIISANVAGQWYSGIDGYFMHLTDLALADWVAQKMKKKRQFTWYPRTLLPDLTINDTDLIPEFEEWQVLFTQGHTDRCLSLYHLPTKRIYVADLMVLVKGRVTSPYPVFYPKRYRASLARVKALQAETIILAHGGEMRISNDEFDRVIDEAPTKPITHWRSIKSKFKKVVLN
jgi:glyoxylase-like metal-dependent hydrolase (beta-lactamase superfamily II)